MLTNIASQPSSTNSSNSLGKVTICVYMCLNPRIELQSEKNCVENNICAVVKMICSRSEHVYTESQIILIPKTSVVSYCHRRKGIIQKYGSTNGFSRFLCIYGKKLSFCNLDVIILLGNSYKLGGDKRLNDIT